MIKIISGNYLVNIVPVKGNMRKTKTHLDMRGRIRRLVKPQ